jgi:hypothetical protein
MELAVEQWRVPEPVWESEEEFHERFPREVVAMRMLQHTRPEVRVPSPVHPVPAPHTLPEEPETIKEAMEKLEERGERCCASVFCSTFNQRIQLAVW